MVVSSDFLVRHCERSEAIHRRQAKKLDFASSQVLLAMAMDLRP